MEIKAAIFDLDGTLIDTEKIYQKLWPLAVKEMGYDGFTNERYLSQRSLGRPYSVARFKEWFGEDFDYDHARTIRKKLFDEYISQHGIQQKPGVTELMEYLHSKGIVTAIATATDIERATEYLKLTGLYGYFDKIISATMVDEGKPSPKVYQYACSQLGFAPNECIAVEDAPNGIISAYRAGLKGIMVPDLTKPDEEIENMLYRCVDSLADIKALV